MMRNSFDLSHKILVFAFGVSLLIAAGARADNDEKPVSIGSIDTSAMTEQRQGLQLSGFGVGAYNMQFNTNENTFSNSALAISLFRSVTDRLSVFAQLTTAVEPASIFRESSVAAEGGETDFSTEIDNLQLRWVTSTTGPDIIFGKFDSPMGIERDDAPLNYQATESFNFQFGRPVKFTGVQVHQAFSEHFEVYGMIANGWDLDQDNNKGKTGAVYALWIPHRNLHIGLGEIFGPENEDSSGNRKATIGTFLYQPLTNLVVGAEANYGLEPAVMDGTDAKWYGGVMFAHYRWTPNWATTLRFESFKDRDGIRTGVSQRLDSITISPQYLFKSGFYGIFRYLERTTLRLPEVALRVDLRFDRSTEPVFIDKSEDAGKKTNSSVTFQTVFLF